MDTASDLSQSARDTIKDMRAEMREGLREAGKAAASASGDIQKDLQALRDDLARLADQVAGILSTRGTAAWRRAQTGVDEAVSEAQDIGRDAIEAVREVSDHFVGAIDESIKTRPYTTLALAAGIAFLFGTAWRR